MIYIGTTDTNESAIYFDVYSAVKHNGGVSVSGTIGDGCYEGEVVVEIGGNESVTFADAWLGGSGFSEFLDRCNVASIEEALIESLRELPLLRPRRYLPHGHAGQSPASGVMETKPVWQSRA